MASIAEASSLFEIDVELDGLLEEIEGQVESEGQAAEDLVARFQQFCEGVGILICDFSKLNHPAHRCLRPTLHRTPHDVPCKTRGQDGVATSFPAGDLHPLQHAGLSRRTVHHRQAPTD